jgi:purine-binding chemotaxis protein CheW
MATHRYRHDPSKSLVGFLVGDVSYAVPISLVREISKPLPIVPLPHAPASVLGVADFRGEVIPVLDMRARFGLRGVADTPKAKWIVVGVEGGLAALAVDAVTGVFGTANAAMSPPPPLGGGEERRGIAGVTSYEGRMVFVLDAGRFTEATLALGELTSQKSLAPHLGKGTP